MNDSIFLDASRTAKGLPFGQLVDALNAGFIEGCQAPIRHHHTMKRSHEPDATLLLMPAWSNPADAQQYLGIKLVTVVPGNTARNLPGLVSTYVLYDGVTGEQLAIMDGNTITGRRTVATSALAARYLAREDASSLLVLGSGRVARLIPEAYSAVRPIKRVMVWDIQKVGAQKLVDQLVSQGMDAVVVDDLATSVGCADIVSAATLATEPLINGQWLSPGTHVDLIGGFRPNMREADDEVMRRAAVYVDTDEALIEAGDLVQPIRSGTIQADDVRATLAQLIRGEATGRSDLKQITCFKAVGSALADLIAARLVFSDLRKTS